MEKFEKSKLEVMDSIPDEVKSRFGQQFFSNLLRCPYGVPPGAIRVKWFEMYEKVRRRI